MRMVHLPLGEFGVKDDASVYAIAQLAAVLWPFRQRPSTSWRALSNMQNYRVSIAQNRL